MDGNASSLSIEPIKFTCDRWPLLSNPANWVKTYVSNANPALGFTTPNAANYLISLYPSAGTYPFDNRTNALKAILFERTLEGD
jgi:hypothetical protein